MRASLVFLLLLVTTFGCATHNSSLPAFAERAGVRNTVGPSPCTTELTHIDWVERHEAWVAHSKQWEHMKATFKAGDDLLHWTCKVKHGSTTTDIQGYAIQRAGTIITIFQWQWPEDEFYEGPLNENN